MKPDKFLIVRKGEVMENEEIETALSDAGTAYSDFMKYSENSLRILSEKYPHDVIALYELKEYYEPQPSKRVEIVKVGNNSFEGRELNSKSGSIKVKYPQRKK